MKHRLTAALVMTLAWGCSAQAGDEKRHQAPSPLAKDAKTSDWPRFLGPEHKPHSPETRLLKKFPAEGPKLVWECPTGQGYACPAVVGDAVVLFFAKNGKETIQRRHAETGALIWEHSYPVDYRDRFGYANGPRAGAVIDGGQVFTFGVASMLTALDLVTGKVLWNCDTAAKYGVPQYFFGSGASPLISGQQIILNLGGKDEMCVAAFDRKTGAVVWSTKHAWGQSYASPIPAKLQGKESVLVFAGGESEPSTGGLLSIQPTDGKLDDAFFWRAKRYASVNAASPVLAQENHVLVTHCYIDSGGACNGSVLVELTAERRWREVWKNEQLACHWMTPVYHEGHFYAFSGEKEHACELMCVAAKDGKILWRERPTWEEPLKGQKIDLGYRRACLLRVDGRFLCLGEMGTLAWLDLSPQGFKETSRCQPILAPQTWTLPALSRGLLYLVQSEDDLRSGAGARVLCYDLREN